MSINIPMSRATSAYPVKNPDQTTNAFTITKESVAASTLKLEGQEKIAALKTQLKGYDMTSINSDELRKIGRLLFDNEMIDRYSLGVFASGNSQTDKNGVPEDTHVKFNAIALLNQRLEDYDAFLKMYPADAKPDTLRLKQGMVAANHALNALSYFANSSRSDLSIDEQA